MSAYRMGAKEYLLSRPARDWKVAVALWRTCGWCCKAVDRRHPWLQMVGFAVANFLWDHVAWWLVPDFWHYQDLFARLLEKGRYCDEPREKGWWREAPHALRNLAAAITACVVWWRK